MIDVTLYTKPGCHLCDAAAQVIEAVGRRVELRLIKRNILDDPEDFRRYQFDIPVILVGGREVARHRITAQSLEAAIRAGGATA
ncbi:MAG TPA: glutaredoxin family protein [Tepidisphaeraceae bacterium]|nr:glutaredoxin family protein [Tepidisphaeraceae bacterium]